MKLKIILLCGIAVAFTTNFAVADIPKNPPLSTMCAARYESCMNACQKTKSACYEYAAANPEAQTKKECDQEFVALKLDCAREHRKCIDDFGRAIPTNNASHEDAHELGYQPLNQPVHQPIH